MNTDFGSTLDGWLTDAKTIYGDVQNLGGASGGTDPAPAPAPSPVSVPSGLPWMQIGIGAAAVVLLVLVVKKLK